MTTGVLKMSLILHRISLLLKHLQCIAYLPRVLCDHPVATVIMDQCGVLWDVSVAHISLYLL